MTRPIKFRAWDKDFKVMLEMGVKASGEPVFHGFTERGSLSCKFFDAELDLMQFTGLLDKNGKEIYEGDVLKYIPTKSDGVTELEPVTGSVFYEIEARNGGFTATDLGGISFDACEVIGNIYENFRQR